MLPVGQEGVPGEDIRVPERQLAAADRLDEETLPGVVLQDQVSDQVILRKGHPQVGGRRPVGLKQEEAVGRHQRPGPQRHRREQQERQQDEQDDGAQVRQCLASPVAHHATNRSPGRR